MRAKANVNQIGWLLHIIYVQLAFLESFMRKSLILAIVCLQFSPAMAREANREISISEGGVETVSGETSNGQSSTFIITPTTSRALKIKLEAENGTCAVELQNTRLVSYRKFARFPITVPIAGIAGEPVKLAFYPTRSALNAKDDCAYTLTVE
ncbi:hypothetical protein [Agrobacterium sp.]|uniref:hypothetical protein n=1 Tax=Agrobacterium sp. TaxID=361 RepID=UPI0028A607E5